MRCILSLFYLLGAVGAQEFPDPAVSAVCDLGEIVVVAGSRGLWVWTPYEARLLREGSHPELRTRNGAAFASFGAERIDHRGRPVTPDEWDRAVAPAGGRFEVRRGRLVRRRIRRIDLPGARRVNALARRGPVLWCGTENGLFRVEAGIASRVPGISGVLTAVAVDQAGRVWAGSGSSFKGVYRFDKVWRHFPEVDAYVHGISVEPTGTVWLAGLGEGPTGEGGAWYYRDGRFQQWSRGRVYDVMARDPSGVLWSATLHGLNAYSAPDAFVRYAVGRKIFTLCAARDGSLWIGYQQPQGVSRLARNKLEHLRDDLAVWAIAESAPGVMWLATPSGLVRYDGLVWSTFPTGPIWPILPDGDGLWLGSLGQGLLHFAADDHEPPRVEVTTDGGLAWSAIDAWCDTPATELKFRWRRDGGLWRDGDEPPSGPGHYEVQAIDRFGNVGSGRAVIEPGRVGWWPWLLLLPILLWLAWRAGFAARAT